MSLAGPGLIRSPIRPAGFLDTSRQGLRCGSCFLSHFAVPSQSSFAQPVSYRASANPNFCRMASPRLCSMRSIPAVLRTTFDCVLLRRDSASLVAGVHCYWPGDYGKDNLLCIIPLDSAEGWNIQQYKHIINESHDVAKHGTYYPNRLMLISQLYLKPMLSTIFEFQKKWTQPRHLYTYMDINKQLPLPLQNPMLQVDFRDFVARTVYDSKHLFVTPSEVRNKSHQVQSLQFNRFLRLELPAFSIFVVWKWKKWAKTLT